MASAAITAAVLANPEAFANAAKTTVEAYGAQIENVGKAIDVLSKAATFIGSLTTKQALIINLSHKSGTWYCYNDIAPIKWTTTFTSHMGAYCTVSVHSMGSGAMHIFKDNANPPYLVNRNCVYIYDGENVSLFFAKEK